MASSLTLSTDSAARKRRREIVTPEGVALPVDLADRGERAGAVLIDLMIIYGSILVVAFVIFLVFFAALSFGKIGIALILLISFFARNFYFIYFELMWQGVTPGKRALGLRVIDRNGGRLTPDAVFARNLMREIEIFIPISLVLSGGQGDGSPWVTVLSLAWISVFVFLPFFNRDRLRAGDIVGGTWVISQPKTVLLPDVAGAPASVPETPDTVTPAATPQYAFSRAQLDIYGIYELQTLENVLRQDGPNAKAVHDEVCQRIQKKIEWIGTGAPVDSKAFLQSFYAALRGHLETRALFGHRRESKHDTP